MYKQANIHFRFVCVGVFFDWKLRKASSSNGKARTSQTEESYQNREESKKSYVITLTEFGVTSVTKLHSYACC